MVIVVDIELFDRAAQAIAAIKPCLMAAKQRRINQDDAVQERADTKRWLTIFVLLIGPSQEPAAA